MAGFSKLGMFGRRGAFDPPPYSTPFIPPAPTDAADAPVAAGGGWKAALTAGIGGLADGFLQQGGMAPVFAPMQQQRRAREQDVQDYERRRADDAADRSARQASEAAQPRFFQNEAGDYVRYDPQTNAADVVYDGPDKPKTPTALEQQITLYRSLNPGASDADVAEIVKRGIAGAQYDPGVYKPMVDYKAQAARVTKATPTYANLHKASPRPRAAPKPPAGFILD